MSETFNELESRIQKNYNSLTLKTRIVAKYCLDHPDKVALETIKQISENLGISISNIVRFSTAMGFSGFSELQTVFRNHFLNNNSGNYRERLKQPSPTDSEDFEPDSPLDDIITHFINEDLRSLNDLKNNPDVQKLEKAAEIFANSDTIWIAGTGRTRALVDAVYYALIKFGMCCRRFDFEAANYISEAEIVKPRDSVFLMSFSPYRDEPKQIAEIVQAKGNPLIVLTDSKLNFYSSRASILISIHDSQLKGFRTLTASMLACQVLTIRAGAIASKKIKLNANSTKQ